MSDFPDVEALPRRILDLAKRFREVDIGNEDDITIIFKRVLGVDLALADDESLMLPFTVVCLTALECAHDCDGEAFALLAKFVGRIHKEAGL